MTKLPPIKCPCCWQPFELTETLWIAESDELEDDTYLPGECLRFLPEHFTPDCYAIDDKGEKCQRRFACPHCHLEIPEDYLKSKPFTVSIVGTRTAGKTHFLVAFYEWQRENLANFGIFCRKSANTETLEKYCETLFPQSRFPNTDKPAVLPFTRPNATQVTIPEKGVFEYPQPFIFSMKTQVQEKPYALCLYDHAGTTFQQENMANPRSPLTQHIEFSDALFFLFDPTQIPRFVQEYKYNKKKDSKTEDTIDKLRGAEKILNEPLNLKDDQCDIFDAMTRFIQKRENNRELFENKKYKRPLIIVVSKCDAWIHCLLPWKEFQNLVQEYPNGDFTMLQKQISPDVENFIEMFYPRFSQAVRNFASDYIYIPVSAMGCDPITYYEDTIDAEGRSVRKEEEGFIPGPSKSIWVGVPFLYALEKHEDQLI